MQFSEAAWEPESPGNTIDHKIGATGKPDCRASILKDVLHRERMTSTAQRFAGKNNAAK
jgi:hypothetical protein